MPLDQEREYARIRTAASMVDLLPALAWSGNTGGEIDFVNQGWLDYTGLRLEEALGRGWIRAIHPHDREHQEDAWAALLRTGWTGDFEARLRRFDGQYRWFLFRFTPQLENSGRLLKWYGTTTDIEDRKLAEDALRKSERQLRMLVDSIPAFVCTMDADGVLETANRQTVEYMGKPQHELRKWATNGDVPDEDLGRVLASWTHSVQTGTPYHIEHRIRGADGVFRWFEVRGLPLRDEENRIRHWYVLLADIDDRKRAEATRLQAEQSLKEVERKLSAATRIATVAELSASIAHEINQPLAAIIANGHACQAWLSGDPPNVSKALRDVERVIRDANSAAEVIHRIRALFKDAPASKAPCRIDSIIGEMLVLLEADLGRNNIQVETDLSTGRALVMADKVQIQQAVLNLVHNAIEAMHGVSADRKRLSIASRRTGVDILVTVSDGGCGIADTAVVFEAFYTTKHAGMGMGLAICRSIIEAHGGRLSVAPNVDGGTTFSFTLPILEG